MSDSPSDGAGVLAPAPTAPDSAQVNLKVITQFSDSPLLFANISLETRISELKIQIADRLPSKPAPRIQRLIYAGHILARDDEKLNDVFGTSSGPVFSQYSIHLVVRDPDTLPSHLHPLQQALPTAHVQSGPISAITGQVPVPSLVSEHHNPQLSFPGNPDAHAHLAQRPIAGTASVNEGNTPNHSTPIVRHGIGPNGERWASVTHVSHSGSGHPGHAGIVHNAHIQALEAHRQQILALQLTNMRTHQQVLDNISMRIRGLLAGGADRAEIDAVRVSLSGLVARRNHDQAIVNDFLRQGTRHNFPDFATLQTLNNVFQGQVMALTQELNSGGQPSGDSSLPSDAPRRADSSISNTSTQPDTTTLAESEISTTPTPTTSAQPPGSSNTSEIPAVAPRPSPTPSRGPTSGALSNSTSIHNAARFLQNPSSQIQAYLLSSPTGPSALVVTPNGTYQSRPPASPLFYPLQAQHPPPISYMDQRVQALRSRLIQNNIARQDHIHTPVHQHNPPAANQPQVNQLVANQPQAPINAAALQQADAAPEAALQIHDLMPPIRGLFGHLWLLLRIFGFIWFFSSGSSTQRNLLMAAAAIAYLAVQTGLFNAQLVRLRRHFDGIMGFPDAAVQEPQQQQQQQPAGPPPAAGLQARLLQRQDGRPMSNPPDPRAAAERLLRERRERDGGMLRRVERGVALFLATLWPGAGDGIIVAEAARRAAALERAAREAEGEAAENAADAAAGAEGEAPLPAGEAETQAVVEAEDHTGNGAWVDVGEGSSAAASAPATQETSA